MNPATERRLQVPETDDHWVNIVVEAPEDDEKFSKSTSSLLLNTSRKILSSPKKCAKKLSGFFKDLVNPSIIMGSLKITDSLRSRSLDTLTRHTDEGVPGLLISKTVQDDDIFRSSPALQSVVEDRLTNSIGSLLGNEEGLNLNNEDLTLPGTTQRHNVSPAEALQSADKYISTNSIVLLLGNEKGLNLNKEDLSLPQNTKALQSADEHRSTNSIGPLLGNEEGLNLNKEDLSLPQNTQEQNIASPTEEPRLIGELSSIPLTEEPLERATIKRQIIDSNTQIKDRRKTFNVTTTETPSRTSPNLILAKAIQPTPLMGDLKKDINKCPTKSSSNKNYSIRSKFSNNVILGESSVKDVGTDIPKNTPKIKKILTAKYDKKITHKQKLEENKLPSSQNSITVSIENATHTANNDTTKGSTAANQTFILKKGATIIDNNGTLNTTPAKQLSSSPIPISTPNSTGKPSKVPQNTPTISLAGTSSIEIISKGPLTLFNTKSKKLIEIELNKRLTSDTNLKTSKTPTDTATSNSNCPKTVHLNMGDAINSKTATPLSPKPITSSNTTNTVRFKCFSSSHISNLSPDVIPKAPLTLLNTKSKKTTTASKKSTTIKCKSPEINLESTITSKTSKTTTSIRSSTSGATRMDKISTGSSLKADNNMEKTTAPKISKIPSPILGRTVASSKNAYKSSIKTNGRDTINPSGKVMPNISSMDVGAIRHTVSETYTSTGVAGYVNNITPKYPVTPKRGKATSPVNLRRANESIRSTQFLHAGSTSKISPRTHSLTKINVVKPTNTGTSKTAKPKAMSKGSSTPVNKVSPLTSRRISRTNIANKCSPQMGTSRVSFPYHVFPEISTASELVPNSAKNTTPKIPEITFTHTMKTSPKSPALLTTRRCEPIISRKVSSRSPNANLNAKSISSKFIEENNKVIVASSQRSELSSLSESPTLKGSPGTLVSTKRHYSIGY